MPGDALHIPYNATALFSFISFELKRNVSTPPLKCDLSSDKASKYSSRRLVAVASSPHITGGTTPSGDGTLENVLALQDELTSKIISSLKIRLTDDDRAWLVNKYTNSIEAYDLFLRGWQNMWVASRDSNIAARDYFLKAVEVDDRFARAYANLAITYIYDFMNNWSGESGQSLERANYYSNRAIEVDNRAYS